MLLLLPLFCGGVAAPAALGNPAGGGWLDAGPLGEYFANDDLSGEPAFVRRDPRIDFDWGLHTRPGGSRSPGFSSLDVDHFSVRWTGRFAARFTESYTFHLDCDDGALLRVRPAGDGDWTTLIDAWDQSGFSSHSAAHPLEAEGSYELMLEYREAGDEAGVRLRWSSPGSGLAVMDPIFELAINWYSYTEQTFADAIRSGRNRWEAIGGGVALLDADGWPVTDAGFIVSEINAPFAASPLEVGDMRLHFRGSADLAVFGNGFLVPGSLSYDAGSNISTAIVRGVNLSLNTLELRFTNTSRTGLAGGPGGLTDVRLMRPSAPGSEESLDGGELFHPAIKEAFGRMTGIRYQRTNDQAREWDERTPPAWPYQVTGRSRPFVYGSRYGQGLEAGSGMAHELEIMLCNEAGLDYYVTVPHLATVAGDDSYIEHLARLIRYGSDGGGVPYAEPTPNPVHPPLNSNLRCYIEISNELWNAGNLQSFPPYYDFRELIEDKAAANDADFQQLNYDGLPLSVGFEGYHDFNWIWVRRYWGLKLKQISDIFRGVFGDEAMPGTGGPQPRIRPYYSWQYANLNDTARMPLEFLDNYFNNAAGDFVAEPRPVNRFIFSGGGAGYYGSGNRTGETEGILSNPSFESNAAWIFEGDAGLALNAVRVPAITGHNVTDVRNDENGWVGTRLAVGPDPIWVYELGRLKIAGNNRFHALRLVRASDGLDVTYAQDVDLSAGMDGDTIWNRCIPVRLDAGGVYYLMSAEEEGGDAFADEAGVVVNGTAIAATGAVSGVPDSDNVWTVNELSSGAVGMGHNLRYATADALGNPDAPDGQQVAWIRGESAVEIAFNIPDSSTSNVYGVAFRAVQRTRGQGWIGDGQELRFLANGEDITYRGINGQPQTYLPHFPWRRVSFWIGDYWFTETFTASPGQPVILRIEGTDASGERMAFLDDLIIASVDAIFEGGIPDGGEAFGQPADGVYAQTMRDDSRWAKAYGLHHMTYEHGWSVGGDSGASPVQEHAKYYDSRAAQSVIDALDIFHRAGGSHATLGTYTTWPVFSERVRQEGTLNAGSWPLTQGLDTTWSSLPALPDNGVIVPADLNFENAVLRSETENLTLEPGGWIAWNLVVPVRADYRIVLQTGGAGASRLTHNESPLSLSAENPMVNLAPGLHTLKVKALPGNSLAIEQLMVTREGGPASPMLMTATDGDGAATLTWSTVPGATAYEIRHGTESRFPNKTLPVSNVTEAAVTGLANGVAHYFAVAALMDGVPGLPSNELGMTPFADGQDAVLVAWDFAGQPGNAVSALAALSSSRVLSSPLTRGPGFEPVSWAPQGSFLGAANPWGQTLEEAVLAGHYAEWTLTPEEGRQVSLTQLSFRAAFQNFTGADSDPRGTGFAWSVDGAAFSDPIPVEGFRTGSFTNAPLFTADLRGIAGLQGVSQAITLRIYFHGMGNFEGGSLGGSGHDLVVEGSLRGSDPLRAWRAMHGLPLDGSEDLANPSGDGIPNLLKYAMNLAPAPGDLLRFADVSLSEADAAGLPIVRSESDESSWFRFIRRSAAGSPGIDYEGQVSMDLVVWEPLTDEPVIEPVDAFWEIVTYSFAPDAAPRRFLRVEVSVAGVP